MEFAFTTHPARKQDVVKFCEKAFKQGFTNIHIDFMDGKFSEEAASGVEEAKQIAKTLPQSKIFVHIMANKPKKWAKAFNKSLNCEIVFQIEAAKKPLKILKKYGQGIAIDLNTSIETIGSEVFEACKYVLVMLVKAGQSGQSQQTEALSKVVWLKEKYPHIKIVVDGGINGTNLQPVIDTGADILSLGSFAYSLIENNNVKQFLTSHHK